LIGHEFSGFPAKDLPNKNEKVRLFEDKRCERRNVSFSIPSGLQASDNLKNLRLFGYARLIL
jgi:hypothetical protein